ncbi:MAG TPA: DUF4232 domain-containing protein [Actinospica sp.]|jgi:hypothetical protein|nr:DUF4232 domain-containing protein [Actinospica sp.]
MHKHIAGAALAVTATILLSGCTSSGTPSAQGSSTSPASSSPTATASSSSAPTSTTTSTGSAGSTCTGDQLSLSASQDSAAGLFDYIVIEFVNQSSTTCTVEGYPGAAGYGVTDSNYAINSTRTLSGNVGDKYTAPAPITLKPGTTASTILEWTDKPTPGHPYADCLRYGAGSFGITAPNVTQTKHIALPSDVCSGLLVHPLVPGSTGRQAS